MNITAFKQKFKGIFTKYKAKYKKKLIETFSHTSFLAQSYLVVTNLKQPKLGHLCFKS